MSFLDDLKNLGKIFTDAGEDLKDFATRGFVEMVIEGRDDYEFPSEIHEKEEEQREAQAEAQAEKMEKLKDKKEKQGVRKGDVIGVHRELFTFSYDHYGVYVNKRCVIHYSSPNSDIGSGLIIRKTTLKKFIGDSDNYFVLIFPDNYDIPSKVEIQSPDFGKNLVPINFPFFKAEDKKNKSIDYNLYSPDETVERAISKLGEKKYCPVNNNCEHFAIWCKTGISESHQVNEFLEDNVSIGEIKIPIILS